MACSRRVPAMTVDSLPPLTAGPRVVLMDVARLAGVSRTTASFVLCGRRDMGISAAAEGRVREAARSLGYRPSLLARSLRMNTTHTIGLLSDGFGGEVFAGELIRGALGAALLHDKMIFVGDTGGDPQVETRLINNMLDRGAGAFVFASQRFRQLQLSPILRAQKVVLVNCTTRPRGTATVLPDERGAGRAVAQALIQSGHRDSILMVGRAGPGASAGLRMRGVNDVLRERGARVGRDDRHRVGPGSRHGRHWRAARDGRSTHRADLPLRPDRDGRVPGRKGLWHLGARRAVGGVLRRLPVGPVAGPAADQRGGAVRRNGP